MNEECGAVHTHTSEETLQSQFQWFVNFYTSEVRKRIK